MIDKDLYDEVCDTISGRTDADGLYHCGYSLLVLGLGRMSEEEREARLQILDATIFDTLEKLDALHQRKRLNGHANRGLG